MTSAADFPNLRSSIWNGIRISPRRTAADIGEAMCFEAKVDPDIVRTPYPGRRSTPRDIVDLRCRIMVAMRREGVRYKDAQTWFRFSTDTLQDFFAAGQKLEAIDA